jgi:hypothetical protein
MRMTGAVALVFLLGFANGCFAGENEKNKIEAATTTKLGDYSLKLETDRPRSNNVPLPAPLTAPKEDAVKPYVGFKLLRQLQ